MSARNPLTAWPPPKTSKKMFSSCWTISTSEYQREVIYLCLALAMGLYCMITCITRPILWTWPMRMFMTSSTVSSSQGRRLNPRKQEDSCDRDRAGWTENYDVIGLSAQARTDDAWLNVFLWRRSCVLHSWLVCPNRGSPDMATSLSILRFISSK